MNMKLNIDFNDIIEAFERSNVSHHFFIDIQEHKIVEIDEEFESLDEVEKQLEELERPRYILLPERMPSDDFSIIELFFYDLQKKEIDSELIERFHYILKHRKPFRNFKALLEQYHIIKEKWFQFKDREIKNQLMNWLFSMDIELKYLPSM